MEGNGKVGSKVVCKIRIPLFEEKQRPILSEGCRSNPYYPATRTIIIVKNRSLLLSDNKHANICLRYVPNDASRQRSHVRDRDSRSSSQRLFAIQSYDKNDIVCATLVSCTKI